MKQMKPYRIIVLLLLLNGLLIGCGCENNTWIKTESNVEYKSPSALIITSGSNEGVGILSDGVVVALESLNSLGCPVRLENRSILYQTERLKNYNLLIFPTLFGYHDTDRRFSLTFLDSIAMHNIKEWIFDGGVLIAGENIGRNRIDGSDRILDEGLLTRKNWELSEVFGISLQEVNLNGFSLDIDTVQIPGNAWADENSKFVIDNPGWILVPVDSLTEESTKSWAYWDGTIRYSGATLKFFGKGAALYLTLSLILHPNIDNGLSTAGEIKSFYKEILRICSGDNIPAPIIGINPWPEGKQAALAITLNAEGYETQLQPVVDSIMHAVETMTLFIKGTIEQDIYNDLLEYDAIDIASMGYSISDYSSASFENIREDLIKSETVFDEKPHGFRFPRYRRSPEAISLLENSGYAYESSIIINHREYYEGSLFPYNIPVNLPGRTFYSTNLLEMSPVYKDDWAFYKQSVTTKDYTEDMQKRDAALFYEFLNRFLNDIIIPGNGMMVQTGHPIFEGYSEITLQPLLSFIRKVKASDSVWIANLSTIAEFWRMREEVDIGIEWQYPKALCKITVLHNANIEGLTLKVYPPDGATLNEAQSKKYGDLDFKLLSDGSYLIPTSINKYDELKLLFTNSDN